MSVTTLDPASALVIIDLQKGIAALPAADPIESITSKANELSAAFRRRGLPVVLVNVAGAPSGRTEHSFTSIPFPPDWTDLMPQLDQHEQDHRVTKHTWGAFPGTGLEAWLRQAGVTQIVLAGVATSAGVESTAREAHTLGFNVTLAVDAMTDLSAEAHANSVTRIFPRIGETGTTREIVALLDNASASCMSHDTRASHALDPSVWKITAVAVLGSLLAQLDATIVNVSLSNLAHDLHASLSTIQWVTSGYLLALTLALPLNGWLIDRIGGKQLYLWCFSIFTLSSALCGLAWSAQTLIAFRLIQGISGGLLAPMAQMMMKRAAGDDFTRIAGYAALPVLLGPLLGPVIAGAILHYASWRWLFLVNLPIGVLALVLAWLFLPDDNAERNRRELDWLGLLSLSPGLALVLFGMERIGRGAGLSAAAIGAALLAVFVVVEKRKKEHALIDLGQFRRRAFAAASIAQFLSNGVMFAGQMLIPLFLIQACGQSPAMMGWMLAPLGLGMMVTFPSLGFLTNRFSARRVAVGGAALSFCATLVLVWLASRGLDVRVLAPALFVRGMGLGAVGLPAISVAYASVDRQSLPMATTTLNIAQRLGGPTLTTLCAVFLGRMLDVRPAHSGSNAWVLAFVLLAVLHVLTVLAAIGLPRGASVKGQPR